MQATGTRSCQRYDTNANNDGEGQSEKILEQKQVLSIMERLPRIRENDPKLETKKNSRTRIERLGINHDVSDPRVAVVNACVGGTYVEVLLGTGAITDLIRTDGARRMVDAPTMERHVGRLETAHGQIMAVDGVVRTRFKLGDIAEEIEALAVPKLKAEMVLGLRSMKEYQCSLVFSRGEDFLWTGTREDSMVPIRHLTHSLYPERMPSLPQEPGGQIKRNHLPRSDMRKRLIEDNSDSGVSRRNLGRVADKLWRSQHKCGSRNESGGIRNVRVPEAYFIRWSFETNSWRRPGRKSCSASNDRGGPSSRQRRDSMGTNERRDCDNAGRRRSDCASILLGRNSRRDERYAFIGNEHHPEGAGHAVWTWNTGQLVKMGWVEY